MAFPQVFALKFRGTGNPGVYEVPPGLSPVQRGDDLPGVAHIAYTNSVPNRMEASTINFKGNTFCLYLGRVFRYRSGSDDDWEEVYFNSIQAVNFSTRYSRLMIYTDLDGVTRMGFVFNNTSGQTMLATTETGFTGEWTTTNFGSFSDGEKIASIVYQNKFYIVDSVDAVVIIDPVAVTRTVATYEGNKTYENAYRFIIHQSRLFLMTINQGSGELQLEIFDGSDFVMFDNITTASSNRYAGASSFVIGTTAAWSDGSFIYLIVHGRNALNDNGSSYFRLDVGTSSFDAVVENTNTVIPASLRNRGSGSPADQGDRWEIYVDNNTDALNPVVYFMVLQSADLSSNWAIYRFVNHTTVLFNEGGWAAGDYTPVHLTYGGNEQLVIDPDAAYAVPDGQDEVLGGFEVSFLVFGALGTDPITIRLLYDDTEGAQAASIATLTGVVTGGGNRVGNQVQDLIPDGGVQLHTLVWDISADNINPNVPVRVMFDVV